MPGRSGPTRPADRSAASDELPALAATWLEARERLPAVPVEEFNTRLQREWSIETGIIERLYTLDEGTTRMLIEQGIDAALIAHGATEQSPEHVAALIRDHHEAVSWLFDTAAERRSLSTSFVKALHQLMTRKQSHASGVDQFGRPVQIELLHGQYKRRPNDPTRTDGLVHHALGKADEGDLGPLVRQFAQLQKDRLLQALSIPRASISSVRETTSAAVTGASIE